MALLMTSGLLYAQGGVPHYCKTDVGILGPYANDGSVKVGDSCFGTQNGKKYNGVAVMSKDNSDDDTDDNNDDKDKGDSKKSNIPHYCKTDVGILGPYPNNGSVKVGDSCFGTQNGKKYDGVAVMSKDDDQT